MNIPPMFFQPETGSLSIKVLTLKVTLLPGRDSGGGQLRDDSWLRRCPSPVDIDVDALFARDAALTLVGRIIAGFPVRTL